MIKNPCLRSVFEALKMLYFHNINQTCTCFAKKTEMHENFQVIVGTSLTHQEQKDTFTNSAAHGRLIVLFQAISLILTP